MELVDGIDEPTKRMNSMDTPLVSIGLPVFNGEMYIRSALDSLLGQRYRNIEIIVCDNASTDATGDILNEYMEKDDRIKYYRHSENLGAAKNYNVSFEKSNGKYFKWAAHDDVLDVQYIERCVHELEKDDNVVLVHPRTSQIDGNGDFTGHDYVKSADVIAESSFGYPQYKRLIRDKGSWTRIFGLIRSDALRNSPLIANYVGSDLTLLGELGLKGKVRDIDDVLFWRREHGNTSTTGNYKPRRKRHVWFDSSSKQKLSLPEWRLNAEMLLSVNRQNISINRKLKCFYAVVGRMWLKRRLLVQDIYFVMTDFLSNLRRIKAEKA